MKQTSPRVSWTSIKPRYTAKRTSHAAPDKRPIVFASRGFLKLRPNTAMSSVANSITGKSRVRM